MKRSVVMSFSVCCRVIAWAVLLLSFFAVVSQRSALAQASDPPGSWSVPVNLAVGLSEQSFFPSVVPDAAGRVHVFWDENEMTNGSTTTWVDYAYWNGESWSDPVDVFVGTFASSASSAKAVVDDQGIMHTIWLDGGALMYAQRHVSSPISARSWIGRQVLSFLPNTSVGPAVLAIDGAGGIHVAYLQKTNVQSGVYYLRSMDGGDTWDSPVLISGNAQQIDPGPGDPYSLDLLTAGDSVHVVWTQREADTGLGYAKSEDGGYSWSETRLLQGGNWPKLVSLDDGQLLILSTGGLPGDSRICLKQQIRSRDQGDTWDRPQEILQPEIKGCLGRMNVVSDNAGEQHLITSAYHDLGSDVPRIWQSRWAGNGWSTPSVVSWASTPYAELGTQPDFPNAAVALGNVLHVVFHTREGRVWHSQMTLSGSSDEPIAYPMPSVAGIEPTSSANEPSVAASQAQSDTIAAVQEPLSLPRQSDAQPRAASVVDPLVVSSLAPAVLVAVVLYLSLVKRKRTR